MLFGIICLLLVLAVAYFHWIQGVFSGAISMALALVAATLAIGMHESLVTGMLGGKLGDLTAGITLMVMFAAIYGIGRIVFDSAVPGYVQVPLYFDKVGGLICGAIAGVCCVGTIAVAAQSMPFGPSIVGFSRHEFDEDKELAVTSGTNNRQVDALMSGVLKVEEDGAAMPPADKESGLIMPVDQWALDFASYQSRAGAFAGGRAFATDHPNLLRELFFNRVGIQPAAKRNAMNIAGRTDVSLVGVYAPDSLLQAEGEAAALRKRTLAPRVTADAKSGKVLLVVRLQPAKGATDTDNKFRFSTGAVRLVIDGKNYYPTGTLHFAAGTPVLLAQRSDDYLIGNGKAVDVVFELPRADVLTGDDAAPKVKKGAYVEVKRFARVDLSDKEVVSNVPQTAEGGIERKGTIEAEVAAKITNSAVPPRR